MLPSINVNESVSQTGNNDQENLEQGGKSREASPMMNPLNMKREDDNNEYGVLKASLNNLQLPKMSGAQRLTRNTSGKSLTIDNKFTRNNAMDNVKGHSTLNLLKENSAKR